jgi:hypothetical protein
VHVDGKCRGSKKIDVSDNGQVTSCQVYPRVTLRLGTLPDDVLLEVFDFYLARKYRNEDAWHTLVHVCKCWRSIVFASPHRLQLRLLCTNKRPVEKALDIWPALPIVIRGHRTMSKPQDANNVLAVLKLHNRVCAIDMLDIPNSFLKRLRAMKMKDPFSALTSLELRATQRNAPALPDSFLGGSAPRLQTLHLDSIPFPALPIFLLSTHDLVELSLWKIPLSRYITPETMVTCLSALTNLKKLVLGFQFPRSRADRETRLVPRLTRLVLPALTLLSFKGDSEYLEDIVGQIDTPLLVWFEISFLNQLVFDTPLLDHFISHTETFRAPHRLGARVTFWEGEVNVKLHLRDGNIFRKRLSLAISSRPSDWQLSSAAQACNSALSSLPILEYLEIYILRSWKDDLENAQWLELLHPFTSMKDLLLHNESIQHVALALEQLAEERATEVLPALRNLFLQYPRPLEPVKKKAIGKFIAARQLSDCPVSVYHGASEGSTWQQVRWEAGDR